MVMAIGTDGKSSHSIAFTLMALVSGNCLTSLIFGSLIGVLKIKYPYSIQRTQVTTMKVSELVAIGCPNYCLEDSERITSQKSHVKILCSRSRGNGNYDSVTL